MPPLLNLIIRPVCENDEIQLLEWVNDPLVRKNSFNSVAIKKITHHEWFSSHLNNYSQCRMFIAETRDGVAIGQIRFENKDLDWMIDYSIDSAFRGNKLGMRMLKMALEKFREDCPGSRFLGFVKKENVSSLNIFKELGFTSELKGNFYLCKSL